MAKGQKTCPACNLQIGCRCLACPCGHAFTTAQQGEPHKADGEGFYPLEGAEILAPAGACPVKWEGDLPAWTAKLTAKRNYGPSALKYWLRRLAPREYRELSRELDFLVKRPADMATEAITR